MRFCTFCSSPIYVEYSWIADKVFDIFASRNLIILRSSAQTLSQLIKSACSCSYLCTFPLLRTVGPCTDFLDLLARKCEFSVVRPKCTDILCLITKQYVCFYSINNKMQLRPTRLYYFPFSEHAFSGGIEGSLMPLDFFSWVLNRLQPSLSPVPVMSLL